MAKTKKLNTTLLIADLPTDMAKILERYKERHGIRVNTTATIRMVREHPGMEAKIAKQERRIRELEQQMGELIHHLKSVKSHEKMIDRIVKEADL
jgi:hypothetical protein